MPKSKFWSRNFKNPSPDSEFALPRYHVCQFSVKTENFDFFGPILPKMEVDFGVKILKIKSGSESASLRYYVYQLSDIRDNFKFFGPKFAQIWILGSKFPKSKSGFGICTSKIPYVSIFRQNGQL